MNRLSFVTFIALTLAGCSKGEKLADQTSDKRQSSLRSRTEEAKGKTPRQHYEALRKEYDSAREAYTKTQQEASDDPGRLKAMSESRDRTMEFAGRFFMLAEQFPSDPVAFDARATVATDRFHLDDEVRALGELVRHHVDDQRLAQFCVQMRYLSRTPAGVKAEGWLREVATKNPHAEVQAQANFSRAELLEDWAQFTRYFRRNPDEAAQPLFRAMLGEECLKLLCEGEADKLDEEAAHLYSMVIKRPTVAPNASGRLADQAQGRLFAIRNLGIGRAAPDLLGEDLEGKTLRLSDLRGNVVVLNFWATWCGPCMALLPRERALVARLKGQPFILVGVDCDKDKEAAKQAAAKEEMTWRSFADGDPSTGPIVKSWGIHSWPTVYVLDAKGVIRFKNVDFPNKERFEDAVDLLLREAVPAPQR